MVLLKEFRYFAVILALGLGFVYTQIQPSGKGKLSGKNDKVTPTQKHIDHGLGIKDKITPI